MDGLSSSYHAGDQSWRTKSSYYSSLSSPSSPSSSSSHLHHHPFGGYFYLNWSHPFVQSSMISCLTFWLQQGVDGFYLINLDSLYIDPDNPESIIDILDTLRSHVTSFRPTTFPGEKILAASRQSLDVINDRLRTSRADKSLLNPFESHETIGWSTFDSGGGGPPSDHPSNDWAKSTNTANVHSMKARGGSSSSVHRASLIHRGSTLVKEEKNVYSYFDLVNIFLSIELNSSETIRDQVNGYFLNEPKSRPWVLWSLGTASKSRLASRIGRDYTLVSTFLLVMLPGSINFFYGDEIGLTNAIDPASGKEFRRGQLCPIPWTSEFNGNFSGGNLTQPWIPINTNYLLNNIQRETESIDRLRSLINFRQYHLRSTERNEKQGNYLFHYVNQGFLGLERYFTRTLPVSASSGSGSSGGGSIVRYRYVLFANLGTVSRVKDFTDKFHFGTIRVASNPKRIQDFLYLRSLRLDPGEALIAEME